MMINKKRKKSFLNGNKAIGTVVATALLLVIAVVGVITFQGWFTAYFSDLQTKVETQSSGGLDFGIERFIDNTLYFRNGGSENISITDIEVESVSCNISQKISSGTQEIDIENCLSNLSTSTPEIVVYTDNSIYSEQIFVDSVSSISSSNNDSKSDSFSLDCSKLSGNWSAVSGNDDLNISDFCVMTYEAKDVSGTATSQPSLSPWGSITPNTAKTQCSNLGNNYSLITNDQWVTITRNAENISKNWNSSIVGEGFLYPGHSDNNPSNSLSVSNISNPYDQTGDSNNGTCDGSSDTWDSDSPYACEGQKRTTELSNGEIIWDLGGNMREWTDETCTIGNPWYGGSWTEWSNSNINGIEKTLAGPIGSYNSTQAVGKYKGCDNDGNYFMSGGAWSYGDRAGLFAKNLRRGESDAILSNIGFRCTYTN